MATKKATMKTTKKRATKKPTRYGRNKNRFAFTMYVTAKQRAKLRASAKKTKTTVVGFVRRTLGLLDE